jgi:hypothetical protein
MNCRAWEDLLHRHLDGGPPQALQRHLLDCPDCGAHRAEIERLLGGLRLLSPAAAPPGLADRLVPGLLAEARAARGHRWRRRAAVVAGLAVAASLLLAFGLSRWAGHDHDPLPRNDSQRAERRAEPAPPEPLGDQVARAGRAVAALTKDTAEDTAREPAALLAAVKDTAEPLANAAPVEPKLDRPMREAAEGVSGGLAPVTDSAKRAFGLFLRDLPDGKGEQPAAAQN